MWSASALVCTLACPPQEARAQNATWLASPGSGDFNTGANWDGSVVPTGTASFSTSDTTSLTLGANTTVGALNTLAGSDNFEINIPAAGSRLLILDGSGVSVGGGTLSLIVGHELRFNNSASAGSASITNNAGGSTSFNTSSSAGSSNFQNNGVLFFNDTSTAGSATITNNNLLRFNDASTGGTAAIINGPGGVLDLVSHRAGSLSIGSLAGVGEVSIFTLLSPSVELQIGANNASTTYSGTFTGSGAITKTGTGTLTLTGDSSATYTGAVNHQQGSLFVNGSLATAGQILVANGAILGGTGQLSHTALASGAILAPGNSIGTVTVNGGLTFNSGSIYSVEVSPADADRTNVTGTATLAGTVNAIFQPGSYVARTYTILNAATISGTFGALTTTSLPAGFAASLSYTANDVVLNLVGQMQQQLPPGTTGNAASLAAALNNYFNNGGTLPPGFAALFGLTGEQLTQALKQISGETGAQGGSQGGTQLTNSFLQLLLNGFLGGRGAGGGFGPATGYAPEQRLTAEAANAYAALDRALGLRSDPFDTRFSVWASGYGGHADARGDAGTGTADTRTRSFGFAAGLDRRFSSDIVAGFSLAGGGTNWRLSGGQGSGRSEAFQAGVYGTRRSGASYVSAAVAYSWHDMQTDRTVTVAGTDVLRAKFEAHNIGGRVEAGHRLTGPMALGVTPYAAAQVQSFFLPSYAEAAVSGSNQFALSFGSRSSTTTRAEIGAWFDTRSMFPQSRASLFARAAWAHDWRSGRTASAAFQSLPGTSFAVNGAVAPADVVLASAGAEMRLSPAVTLSARFDGEFASGYESYAGTGTIRYAW